MMMMITMVDNDVEGVADDGARCVQVQGRATSASVGGRLLFVR
jgi:hypothetical protein